MRKTRKKGVKIEQGAWVGISPRCRTSAVNDYGFTEGQIQRLREGRFVAVQEDGDVWLCWDVNGRDVTIKVPKTVLRAFSDKEFDTQEKEPLGSSPGALIHGGCVVDPWDHGSTYYDEL